MIAQGIVAGREPRAAPSTKRSWKGEMAETRKPLGGLEERFLVPRVRVSHYCIHASSHLPTEMRLVRPRKVTAGDKAYDSVRARPTFTARMY